MHIDYHRRIFYTFHISIERLLVLSKIKRLTPIIILIVSCNTTPTPSIKEQDLIPVLVDIHIAEAAMQSITHKHLKDSIGDIYYNQIFEIHGVEKADFDQTMAILREDPYQLKSIYKTVLDTINARNQKE